MEARRRLALLSSHLRPVPTSATLPPASNSKPFSYVSPFSCSSSSLDADGGNLETGCVFCKIILGESPALKLYEDDTCLCILDIYPVSPGHSLIIPKAHFPSLQATPPHVVGAMCSKVPFISNALLKATGCDSFNLLVNNGAPAGQVIFHARDGLWTCESLPRHPLKLDQETSQLADRVCKELLFSENSEESMSQGSNLLANE
ncbi:adenylylsulfatase HINT3 isoform X2 [Diospyros lotus]|uniref:adenylylsulfatase HINT3 isoform X2 n=1 Tax=Diospyros lotus TaxID=55363 RepID=UPI0022545043|nr:adenylylsulfatase HINT3 isoform X2 [Diospyros lotus]